MLPWCSRRTTLECTYRTVGTVHRPFPPIRTLFAHYSHTIRTVVASHSQLFSHHSHTIRTVAHYSHGQTLFAHSHTIRTLFARSHTIRTVAHYSHTIRTLFAPSSPQPHPHTIRTSSHLGHTIRAVGVSPFALVHAVFTQFTPVRICECAIGTL